MHVTSTDVVVIGHIGVIDLLDMVLKNWSMYPHTVSYFHGTWTWSLGRVAHVIPTGMRSISRSSESFVVIYFSVHKSNITMIAEVGDHGLRTAFFKFVVIEIVLRHQIFIFSWPNAFHELRMQRFYLTFSDILHVTHLRSIFLLMSI